MSITSVRSAAFAFAFALSAIAFIPSAAHAANLITNPSVETANASDSTVPQGWNKSSFGANASTFAYPAAGTDGAKAIQVDMTGAAAGSGANWYFDSVPVTAGTSYFFSDKYKSNVATEIDVRYTIASTTPGLGCSTAEADTPAGHCYQYNWVADVAAPASPTAWNTLSTLSITPPTGTDAMTVFHLLNGAGSLATDAYSLDSANVNAFSQGYATLSFDDGLQSQYDATLGAGALNNALGNLKATFYIITGLHGSNVTSTPPENGYMSLAEIQALQAAGYDIGDHTRTHPVGGLAASGVDLNSEITGSRQDLTTSGLSPVNNFAYPEGVTNATIQAAVTSAGFTGARGIDEGFNDKTTNPNDLFAYEIYGNTPVSYVHNLAAQAVASKTWVIFFFHEVTAGCSTTTAAECVTPTMLKAMATDLATFPAGTMITVADGLAQMGLTAPTPVIAPHADVFFQATTTAANVVTYPLPAVTQGGTVSCLPASGSAFAFNATTTVTCTSAGAADTTFGVGVHDTVGPVFTIGTIPATIAVHSAPFVYPAASATDAVSGDALVSTSTKFGAVATSSVNTDVIGTYTITYSATDAAGNLATTSRTVSVVDANAPVITLLGDASTTVALGTTFTDPGTTATDDVDANITVVKTYTVKVGISTTAVATSSVNTNIAGTYTISYNATDTSGNHATTKTRDVVVSSLVLSSQGSTAVSQTSATITWTTSHPATSRVVYDTVSHPTASTTLANYGYAKSTVEDPALTTTHSVTVNGLTADTTYYFRSVSHGSPETVGDEITVHTPAVLVVVTSGGGGGCGGCGGGGSIVGNGSLSVGFVNNGSTGQVLGASTQVLTDAQIDAILGLLRSFDADQSVIDNVNRALRGQGSASGKYVFTKTLVIGSANADVTALQNLLTAQGIYHGPVTGYFGPLTSTATKAYQAAHGISQTGTVGPLTRASLNQ